jgi:uncharacterized protein (UPF0303 family)
LPLRDVFSYAIERNGLNQQFVLSIEPGKNESVLREGTGATMPSIEEDMHTVAEQERLLQFESFNADTAWTTGSALRADAIARQAGMTFEIQIAGRVLFACSTLNASSGQADWIRRKRNTVMRFGKSSYAVGLQLKLEGKEFAARHEISLADYAAHGGGFPIVLKGTGLVGTVVSSGLDQRTDHAMVVEALTAVLGIEVPALG